MLTWRTSFLRHIATWFGKKRQLLRPTSFVLFYILCVFSCNEQVETKRCKDIRNGPTLFFLKKNYDQGPNHMPACRSQYIKNMTAARGWQNVDYWAATARMRCQRPTTISRNTTCESNLKACPVPLTVQAIIFNGVNRECAF